MFMPQASKPIHIHAPGIKTWIRWERKARLRGCEVELRIDKYFRVYVNGSCVGRFSDTFCDTCCSEAVRISIYICVIIYNVCVDARSSYVYTSI